MRTEIIIPNQDELITRINLLKQIFNEGVNFDLFDNIILHMRDGVKVNSTSEKWNTFNLENWVLFFQKNGFNVNEQQLQLMFDYFCRYLNGLMQELRAGVFRANHNSSYVESGFFIEKVALLSLEN